MKKKWNWLVILLIAAGMSEAYPQTPQLVSQIAVKNIKSFSVDELNCLYLVDRKNGIIKYNAQKDSVAFFQQITNGPIGTIDVTDPMRVLVYYPNFLKIVILDRMLAPINTVDLKSLNIQQPTAIATAKDGGFWVYDYFQVRLIKLDRQYKNVAGSNDLRVMLNEVPKFEMMFEKDNELWAYDKDKGLYIFNRFGDFINKLELQVASDILNIQKEQNQIIYTTSELMSVYNLQDFTTRTLNVEKVIGKKAKGVFINRNNFYVLSADGLSIYNVNY